MPPPESPRVTIALLAVALATACALGCSSKPSNPPRITLIGDSITQGIVNGRFVEDAGGFPGRLGRALAGRAVVLNRGIGGFSTRQWLESTGGPHGPTLWNLLHVHHPETGLPDAPPPGGAPLAEAVVEADRSDVVLVLLGANDMALTSFNGDPPVDDPGFPDRVLERLRDIEQRARRHADLVLVATILPSERDPDAVRRELNRRIRAEFRNVVDLAKGFEETDWRALLSDNVHPNGAGYDLLADLVARELERRDLLPPPVVATPSPAGEATAGAMLSSAFSIATCGMPASRNVSPART